jgi:signal transduction histidine kinase
MLKGNLAKIVQHGRRADSIVKNMLAHSREGGGELRMVDANAMVDEALNLAYHGARAEKPGIKITLERAFDPAAGQIALYPQEFTRVLLNLFSNAFHAANKKLLDGKPGGFEPVLRVTTKAYADRIKIKVMDNGAGIPDAIKAHIFEPFFTTKPTGEGTGLGLSLSHDIVVKLHGGRIDILTEPGEFTEFTVTLPRKCLPREQHE